MHIREHRLNGNQLGHVLRVPQDLHVLGVVEWCHDITLNL